MERLSLFKMDNNIQPDFTGAYAKIYEKATPESGTGKYYNEKNPTTQQLKAREKYAKIKDLTSKGKHKEASALYKEAKYDNTKSPDYAKKKAALAKKHGGYDKIKGHPQYEETKVVGRHRLAYEKYKTELQEDYINKFDTWVGSLCDEGYDIDRWERGELFDAFINENNLWNSKESVYDALEPYEFYDELDEELLQIAEDNLGEKTEDEILSLMESGWHRRNPGKKHPLESGSTTTQRRPVSDAEKKSTDKTDRMYVAMRRVKDRQKGYSKDKSDAADRLYSAYSSRQSARKKGASAKEAAAGSHGEFGSKGFSIKRGGRAKGTRAPGTDRGTGNKARRRQGKEVKDKGFMKGMVGTDPKGYRK